MTGLAFHGTTNRSIVSITAKNTMPITEMQMMAANCRVMLKLEPATVMT